MSANPQIDKEYAAIEEWQRDPVFFMHEVLGVKYLTPDQKKVALSVRDNRRTAVPAANGVGKTWLAAREALWFLLAFHNSKVVTTAPTWAQIENLLWRELRSAHKQAKVALGGTLLKTQLSLSEDWFAIGLSTNEETRFQGIHAPFVMIIFDEATGVADEIWEASEGIAVGTNDRFLAIGNPTDPTSRFKRVCDSPLWNVIRLDGENHPNVLENRMVVPGAITAEWIREKEIEYGGRESPFFRARVKGLFPEIGDDTLISLADVERAQKRWTKPLGIPSVTATDVARFGTDETVFIDLYSEYTDDGVMRLVSDLPKTFVGKDTMETAGRLKASVAEKRAVDDSGVGGGVSDRLREQKVQVTAYIAGSSSNEPEKFLNLRAESYWKVRELLRQDLLDLPPDNKLAADLTNIKYTYTSKGQIKLEAKDEIKKRIGRSPDRSDALAIAISAATVSIKPKPKFFST